MGKVDNNRIKEKIKEFIQEELCDSITVNTYFEIARKYDLVFDILDNDLGASLETCIYRKYDI